MNYTLNLLKLKNDEKKDISKLEINVENGVEESLKKKSYFETILAMTVLIIGVIGVFCMLLMILNFCSYFHIFPKKYMFSIGMISIILFSGGGSLLLFIGTFAIEDFLAELKAITKNNADVIFNVDEETISCFDEEGILHEIHIPEGNKIKYWNKDYVKIDVTKNGIVKYYPLKYRKIRRNEK